MSADQSRNTTGFREFNNAIKVPSSTLDSVNYRLGRMVNALDSYYYGSIQKNVVFRIGSIGRQTDIHTSDVDIIYKVPNSLYGRYSTYLGNGQSQMLQDFRKALLSTYPDTYIKADGLVAIVAFTDGIVFELMPGMQNNDYSFTFPVTKNGGSWSKTNPLPEIAAMDDIHRHSAYNARKLARMVRAWKEHNGVSMGGLLIDTYVHNFLKQYDGKDRSYVYYDYMSRDFFEYLSKQNDFAAYTYALGSNQQVAIKRLFASAAKTAHNNALAAIEAFEKEQYWTSTMRWRDVYGTKFPML
jgi:hypothetical protein